MAIAHKLGPGIRHDHRPGVLIPNAFEHGGNRDSGKATRPIFFSILKRASPDLDPAALVSLENSWKERLHTCGSGLNAN